MNTQIYYVYVLISLKDKKFYIGFSGNLKKRLKQHKSGMVKSTSRRLPVKLIYYECYSVEDDARRNEKYYKTSKGRNDLHRKLLSSLKELSWQPGKFTG
jgi:putative endonuclease